MTAVVRKLFEHMFWADQRMVRLLESPAARTAETLSSACDLGRTHLDGGGGEPVNTDFIVYVRSVQQPG